MVMMAIGPQLPNFMSVLNNWTHAATTESLPKHIACELTCQIQPILQEIRNIPPTNSSTQGGIHRHTRTRGLWHDWSHSNLLLSRLFTFSQAVALNTQCRWHQDQFRPPVGIECRCVDECEYRRPRNSCPKLFHQLLPRTPA